MLDLKFLPKSESVEKHGKIDHRHLLATQTQPIGTAQLPENVQNKPRTEIQEEEPNFPNYSTLDRPNFSRY